MSTFRIWRWSALAVAFGLTVSAAQAEMITPDSIPNQPNAVGSANGTPVYASNYVTNQYAGLGLNIAGAAITQLNNISVWAPLGLLVGGSPLGLAIDYAHQVGGTLVSPGSLTPMTVSSLTVDTFGLRGTPILEVSGLNGQSLKIVPVSQKGVSPFSLREWTFTGAGISSFSVFPSSSQTGAWGLSEVSFTPAAAPEPSSLVLAGLGVLGLAARFGWRRVRPVT